MIKIPVYEFPPVINIATIQDIECQTGNRFRESPEYLVGKIDVKNPGPGSEVQQGVDALLVEADQHFAVHHQGGRRANAETEQLVPGLFVYHQIFSHE